MPLNLLLGTKGAAAAAWLALIVAIIAVLPKKGANSIAINHRDTSLIVNNTYQIHPIEEKKINAITQETIPSNQEVVAVNESTCDCPDQDPEIENYSNSKGNYSVKQAYSAGSDLRPTEYPGKFESPVNQTYPDPSTNSQYTETFPDPSKSPQQSRESNSTVAKFPKPGTSDKTYVETFPDPSKYPEPGTKSYNTATEKFPMPGTKNVSKASYFPQPGRY